MIRSRLAALAAAACVLALLGSQRGAEASPEIHNFSLVFSAIPTSVTTGGFNDAIDQYNRAVLEPRNFRGLEPIGFGWLFDVEMHYIIRPNVALNVGVGQLKSQTERGFLPLINQAIDARAEVLTVPVHVGADYYFTPYTQGDFQARWYVGGGVLSNVYSRVTLQQSELNTDPSTTLGGSFTARATRDSPGFYAQTGAHMFFASSWSVMLGVLFRSAKIENMVDQDTGLPILDLRGNAVDFDAGGVGARLGFAKGF